MPEEKNVGAETKVGSCCSHDHDHEPSQAQPPQLSEHAHEQSGFSRAVLSLDNLGIAASVLCLIHCLAMPFLIAILPFLGLKFLDSHESHIWLGSAIIAFALFAIVPGYWKHKRVEILAGMIFGVGLVMIGSFFSHHFALEEVELPVVIAGNLTLVTTHILNMRQVRRCCDHH